ncbi:MAG: InlB B-repeat-containing protein [Lachnospiraceae bacterium]|nr:InlB B-repeat-containing protein [Lachnospiraceae bacterium]
MMHFARCTAGAVCAALVLGLIPYSAVKADDGALQQTKVADPQTYTYGGDNWKPWDEDYNLNTYYLNQGDKIQFYSFYYDSHSGKKVYLVPSLNQNSGADSSELPAYESPRKVGGTDDKPVLELNCGFTYDASKELTDSQMKSQYFTVKAENPGKVTFDNDNNLTYYMMTYEESGSDGSQALYKSSGTANPLYGYFYVNPIVTFSLNGKGDGDNTYEKDNVPYDHAVTVPESDPTAEGYTFTGWYTDADCTTEYDGSEITDNTTLYAGWKAKTMTVTFSRNGKGDGDDTYATASVDYGTAVSAPDAPTADGYTFTGWYTDPGCPEDAEYVFDSDSNVVKSDMTLYAGWKENKKDDSNNSSSDNTADDADKENSSSDNTADDTNNGSSSSDNTADDANKGDSSSDNATDNAGSGNTASDSTTDNDSAGSSDSQTTDSNTKKAAAASAVVTAKKHHKTSTHTHTYQWVLYEPATDQQDALMAYRCTECGNILSWQRVPNSAYYQFNADSANKISKAPQNGTVTISTDKWVSFAKRLVLPALQNRPDVTVIVKYVWKGTNYKLVIPAGTDLSSFFDENGYCGFMNLNKYQVPWEYGKE